MMNAVIDTIQTLHKSRLGADFLSCLFQDYLEQVMEKELQVCLFGAGAAGKELAECLMAHGVTPALVCTSKQPEAGSHLLGIPVVSFEQAKQHAGELVFVVASNDHKEAIRQVLIGHSPLNWCSIDDHAQLFYYLQIYKWHQSLSDLDVEKIERVYDLFEDEQSRELFIDRINLVTSYADYGLFSAFIDKYGLCAGYPIANAFTPSVYTPNYESYLYFNNDVLSLQDGDALMDAGAFDGDSAVEFVHACRRQNLSHGRIICVEADTENYKKLLANSALPLNTEYVGCGLWSEKTILQFASSSQTFVTEPRVISEQTRSSKHGATAHDSFIETMTIDELVKETPIHFIKMDIEGAEIEALKGAVQTLQAYKPKLAISVYHQPTDIYEIPLLVKQICPDYKLFLRHLSTNLCETVLLAYAR